MSKITKRYNRKATTITISIFYEHHQLNKYNFEPVYQRDYNVWEIEQQEFLIDTIMKNFPIPPIFLEQNIDEDTGKTSYDVIDGKQRLTSIIAFIEGRINLPNSFGKDQYGLASMSGKSFSQLQLLAKENEDVQQFIRGFWSYVLSIEYIESSDGKVVDNIFDRLNRGGERLNSQELRKANYYDSMIYKQIENFRKNKYISITLDKLNKNRLEDLSFITELYLLVWKETIIDGVEKEIDKLFEIAVEQIDEDISLRLTEELQRTTETVEKFNLDYDTLKIKGVSHLYAIWYLAYYVNKYSIAVSEEFNNKLLEFYSNLRGQRDNNYVIEYHNSMQSASKYKASRKKRINALLQYLDILVENP